MGVCGLMALVMLFFVNILPTEDEIESVQWAIFHEKVVKVKSIDNTRVELN